MAITTADLAIALRLSVDGLDLDAAQTGVLERLAGVATALVESYAPEAPQAIKDESAIRVASYLYDSPPHVSNQPQNAFVSSGAMALLSFWREQRAHRIGASRESA